MGAPPRVSPENAVRHRSLALSSLRPSALLPSPLPPCLPRHDDDTTTARWRHEDVTMTRLDDRLDGHVLVAVAAVLLVIVGVDVVVVVVVVVLLLVYSCLNLYVHVWLFGRTTTGVYVRRKTRPK